MLKPVERIFPGNVFHAERDSPGSYPVRDRLGLPDLARVVVRERTRQSVLQVLTNREPIDCPFLFEEHLSWLDTDDRSRPTNKFFAWPTRAVERTAISRLVVQPDSPTIRSIPQHRLGPSGSEGDRS